MKITVDAVVFEFDQKKYRELYLNGFVFDI